jgi:adenosine deaminase
MQGARLFGRVLEKHAIKSTFFTSVSEFALARKGSYPVFLQVERIDHGVRCTESPALVQRLSAQQTPLTVCPLSNIKLCVFETMAQHNLPELLAAGLNVTVNSDDPAYFGGSINVNFVELFKAHPRLGAKEAWQLARNSIESSFVSPEQKSQWLAKLNACFIDAGATLQ